MGVIVFSTSVILYQYINNKKPDNFDVIYLVFLAIGIFFIQISDEKNHK